MGIKWSKQCEILSTTLNTAVNAHLDGAVFNTQCFITRLWLTTQYTACSNIQSPSSFQHLPHRMDTVSTLRPRRWWQGVRWSGRYGGWESHLIRWVFWPQQRWLSLPRTLLGLSHTGIFKVVAQGAAFPRLWRFNTEWDSGGKHSCLTWIIKKWGVLKRQWVLKVWSSGKHQS